MDKYKSPNKHIKPAKKASCLQKPSYALQEEKFLNQTETFSTGLWRALRIFIEYMRGFYAFRNVHNCITVFGSARFKEDHRYYQMARAVGRMLALDGFTVMTGGGPGIMEAANRGAREGKGMSVSCNIELPPPNSELPNRYVDKKITLHFFFVRKVMLTKYSSAFIVMPGGLGTLDELFEMSTLLQTKKIKYFPLVLMGKEFWSPLLQFMEKTLLERGTIFSDDISRLMITDSPEEALSYIKNHLHVERT
jgi:uncharacterized protein (TIGR00730 family)